MRSNRIPISSHHTDRELNPPKPTEAKGEPLSVRIASGRPYSRKVAMNKGFITRLLVLPTNPWQHSKYRLCASLIVKGSHRCPLPILKYPFKSALHTWLIPAQCPNGLALGVALERRLCLRTSPCRASTLLTVLSHGQSAKSTSCACILGAPHRRVLRNELQVIGVSNVTTKNCCF